MAWYEDDPITEQTAYDFVKSANSAANSFLNKLGLIVKDTTPFLITPVFPAGPSAPAFTGTVPPPSLVNVTVGDVQTPALLDVTLNIDTLLPEPFDDNPPALTFGTAPNAFSEAAPSAPGVDTSYVMPELSVTLPSAPSLMTLTTHTFDGITLPTIDSNIPELVAVAPTVIEYKPGSGYASSLLTALQATLQDRIENGGTGLPPEAENALWDRQREREALATDTAILELERMETLGYAFPPGTFADARMKVTTEMAARTVSLGREIMIKQAELELANIQQSLTVATQLESNMMSYTNQVEQRIFESTRYATEAGISLYNAKVQAYAAYLDAYKMKVAVYEAQIRGELARVDSYKALIQAETAKAEMNTALVNQYRVTVDAALANVEVFKAEVGAIQAKAELEKLKIGIYGEQVRAYTAKIGAYTAGVEGFRAGIQAEVAKQDAFKSQVEAYTAQVNASTKLIEAKIEEYKGKVMAKTAEWEGYKAAATIAVSKAQVLTEYNKSAIEAYKAEITAGVSYNELLTKQWQVALEQSTKSAEIGIAASKVNAELVISNRALAVEAAKTSAQVSAQIAAAALNQVSWSTNRSYGWNTGWSTNTSTSENTNYNYSV